MILPKSPRLRIGLLATEMATRGGVQSFMQRISEVISSVVADDQDAQGYCLSLNDSTDALRQHLAIPTNLDVWGAAGAKSRLVIYVLTKLPKTDVLFVGHLGVGPVAYFLKLIGRVRHYYVILHGIEAWRRVTPLKRLALKSAVRLIATTNFTAEEFGRQNGIPNDHFAVIPLCADERQVAPSPAFRLEGGFKLLCVARQNSTERYKGFEHIFEALVKMRGMYPQLHLNIVGEGEDQPRLKAIADDFGITDKVTFWGRLSDADLASAYQQCDLFVMPSKCEGFGIVFLEAMRHGKPCVGGKHGGTPDVIVHGHSGYLVEYGNVSSLAETIGLLVDDTELKRQLGLAGKALVESKFSTSTFRGAYTALIQWSTKSKVIEEKI